MATQGFPFESCLLKHYVRTNGWLPFCIARRISANNGVTKAKQRRLKYFTFCAIGAVDVLMLDVANVIRPSSQGWFDTVVFFDHTPEAVLETKKRIPGAIGFPGSFVDTVLAQGPDTMQDEEASFLAPPSNKVDSGAVRQDQLIHEQRRQFIGEFPFDIINLDLQDFVFRANSQFPGKVISALRKVFDWQQRPLHEWAGKPLRPPKLLDGFTLMFTTQIGPPDISSEYTDMLGDYLQKNIDGQPALGEILRSRMGTDDVAILRAEQFDEFFKLGFPKVLAGILKEKDWYIDPDKGVTIYQFARAARTGDYQILHMVMDVCRQTPPVDRRAPGTMSARANAAYLDVARKIFETPVTQVTTELVSAATLNPTLEDIFARRRKYYPDEDLGE